MVTERLTAILEGIRNLPAWPPVAARVLELAQREEVVPRELAAVIQTDAGLTARTLKLCNSAHYGFQRTIASLAEAANRLGVQTLVNLVLTSCAAREFNVNGTVSGQRRKRLWERSVMNAIAADLLASVHGGVDHHRAYTLALLQNIGHIVIDDFLEEYADEIAAARRSGLDMLEAERAVLGIDHGRIGGRLARRWGLPETIVEGIVNHHHPELAELDPELVAIAHLAESITYALALGEGLDGLAYTMSSSAVGLTGIGPTAFASLEQQLLEELQRARDLIDGA